VSKVISRFPQVLGCSIEENLKPTVQWLRDSGLKEAEVSKVISRLPQVLGYSIEENLKPTVQWLRDLGLQEAELSKVISRLPQVLGCSIEENLKPTVQWLRDLGLSEAEVSTVISRFPAVLGYSIEENLCRKMSLLGGFMHMEQTVRLLVHYPMILGLSFERWTHRLQVLRQCGRLCSFGPAMLARDDVFAKRYQSQPE
ncbi:MTERF5, partial [Symbiodinium pilosum]